MSARISLPEHFARQPFTVERALDAGIGPGRLRGADLQRPFRGVRSATALTELLELAGACAQRMPAHAFFSHVTAARLWGIPLPARLELRRGLDVSSRSGQYTPYGAGVRGHRLLIDPVDIVDFAGLRVTSRERTWCDLAALLTEEELVGAGDFLLWRRHPPHVALVSTELSDALERFSGRRGRPLIVNSIPFLSDRADSPPESTMRVRFHHAGLPKTAVNEEVYDDWGTFVGTPDLAFEEFRLAFDYEGDVHRTDVVQWRKDLKRAPRFEDAGWAYVRGGAPDLVDSSEIISILVRRLRSRGWSGR